MFVMKGFPAHWSTLRKLIWLFQASVGQTERDPASDVVNIGRVDYMTLAS